MEPTYAAAIEHMRVMADRIRQQEAAIHLLKNENQDSTDAERRLTLLHAVSQEMRLQLAQLAPSAEQVAAPAWVLPLVLLDTKRT